MFDQTADVYKFGFREIFRIMAPGVWLLVVFSNIFSSSLWAFLSKIAITYPQGLSTAELLALAWIIGFVWFSLQVSKRLPKYKKYVNKLQGFMYTLKAPNKGLVDKPVYDYYIANIVPSAVRVRIHYFASMYYMIMDLAAISGLAFLMNIGAHLINSVFQLGLFKTSLKDIVLTLLLAIIYIIERRGAMRFLKDVMLFSLFCLKSNKSKVAMLISVAQDSNDLEVMSNL
jgi:hypothetical protein